MEFREFRSQVSGGDDGRLSFVAAPFNSETVIGDLDHGGFREQIAPGAFTKALRESDTVLLCDHDMSKPLARVSASTLRLRETDGALVGDADLVDTTYARDLQANVKAGNKGGMSIGFTAVKDEWFDDDGYPSNRSIGTRRILREVKLPEVSCVTNPAYKDTSVLVRDDSLALIEERAGNPKKPYGDVKYADPKNGKYPIDTEEHVRAAWAYINMPKNAAKYPLNGVSLSEVKARIRAAMKEHGIEVEKKAEELPNVQPLPDPYEDKFYHYDPDLEEVDDDDEDERDDPDGKEYAAIDAAARALAQDPPDVEGALNLLRRNQASRGAQEPDSTPEDDNSDALQMRARALLSAAAAGAFDEA